MSTWGSKPRRGPSAATKSWVLAATILGSSMAFIDGSVVTVALPAIQGLGGALLVPGSLPIINDVFDSSERGHAIGTWAGFSAVSVAIGPAIGGALVDTVSWRAVFFINVPLAVITLAMALRHVPESRDQQATSIDWLGGALAVIGLGALTYGLTAAVERSWSDPRVLGATVGGAGLALCSGLCAAAMINDGSRGS